MIKYTGSIYTTQLHKYHNYYPFSKRQIEVQEDEIFTHFQFPSSLILTSKSHFKRTLLNHELSPSF